GPARRRCCNHPGRRSGHPPGSWTGQENATPTWKPRTDSAGAHDGTWEVDATTAFGITGAGLTGTLRLTWVRDDLAHVLGHAEADETSGTWTGLACPDHGFAAGTDVDTAILRRLCAHGDIADLIWEAPDELVAEHELAFGAAMRAYQAGDARQAARH